jgi:large conductance mechanosensitive channel
VWKEFRDFIARGNVIDLAVGVVIGAAFGRIVTTLVEGILMPPLGLALGQIDFSSLFIVLDASKGVPMSLAEAKANGVPVIAYGQFVNDVIGFLIVAAAANIGGTCKQCHGTYREGTPEAGYSIKAGTITP